MDLHSLCHSFRFRVITPQTRIRGILRTFIESRIGILQALFDRFTVLPSTMHPARVAALRRLQCVPRMSTIAIGAILSEAVRQIPGSACFLNIGVWNGYTFFAGMAENPEKRCIGVDNFSEFGGPRSAFMRRFTRFRTPSHEFHDTDWREYMREHRVPIGVFFYDASHDSESQYEALKAAHPHLIPGALILVDDWNWQSPREGTERFLREFPGYETIFEQRTPCNAHPTFWNGIVVLRKCS